ncbi:CaiB/BaiF CoA transferase family protein [Dethiosulfatarculus sandiegensis]|uniref:CoA transferase n=1 Tax=Dethiosulfatarculus sandiegensis TaxID=1429043 RepID=A0A0D2HRB7_9BACT|nr:CaiB/BaiF CoA-transferase family protein [Dethiosulfatarculus sandiegensis]KIX13083.1 CoA transferase [Dethiosulfatarculus sandiegensis]
MSDQELPLAGIKVLEMTHTVMGPTAGLILADLGASVLKIEKTPKGDDTRHLKGFGAGFFPYFNRNKASLCLDLKSEKGADVLNQLVKQADVLIENFGPGTIERLGFGYDKVKKINPKLIFCSLKGFMPGPYEKRLALDEVVQMMGGLAYMTGPKGRPLRAGASVTDILGGTFGAVGILAALREREKTGFGQLVKATLFESIALLMAQHMGVTALTGQDPPPMPERGRTWSVYDLFSTSDNEQVFIGITSDRHWKRFCETFGFDDFLNDPSLGSNQLRVENRDKFLPELKNRLGSLTKSQIMTFAQKAVIPFAQVSKPGDLFDDPHLNDSGWLMKTELPNGQQAKFPKLPLKIGEHDLGLYKNPPKLGQGGKEWLLNSGFSAKAIDELISDQVLVDKQT